MFVTLRLRATSQTSSNTTHLHLSVVRPIPLAGHMVAPPLSHFPSPTPHISILYLPDYPGHLAGWGETEGTPGYGERSSQDSAGFGSVPPPPFAWVTHRRIAGGGGASGSPSVLEGKRLTRTRTQAGLPYDEGNEDKTRAEHTHQHTEFHKRQRLMVDDHKSQQGQRVAPRDQSFCLTNRLGEPVFRVLPRPFCQLRKTVSKTIALH